GVIASVRHAEDVVEPLRVQAVDVGEVALVRHTSLRIVQIHPGGASQYPKGSGLAGAQQQEGRDVVRGVLLAAEDGDLEEVEEGMACLVEQDENDGAFPYGVDVGPALRRQAGGLPEIVHVLVTEGDRS